MIAGRSSSQLGECATLSRRVSAMTVELLVQEPALRSARPSSGDRALCDALGRIKACRETPRCTILWDCTAPPAVRVVFANGMLQVSYDIVRQVRRSRVGDRVTTCVVALPDRCPPGDDRGVIYRTHDWRTHESWTLPDSQHGFGGA
jgi:hypothetical protein